MRERGKRWWYSSGAAGQVEEERVAHFVGREGSPGGPRRGLFRGRPPWHSSFLILPAFTCNSRFRVRYCGRQGAWTYSTIEKKTTVPVTRHRQVPSTQVSLKYV